MRERSFLRLSLASGRLAVNLSGSLGGNGFLLLLHKLGGSGWLSFLIAVTTLSELVDTLVVDLVLVALVKPNEEDDIIAESGQTMQPRHLNGECKEVVDEGVQELVSHRLAGHVGNGLQAIVDVQARNHHQETIGIDTANKCLDDVGIPRLVGVVQKTVSGVGEEKRHRDDVQVAERNLIVLLGLLLGLTQFVLVFEDNHVGQEGKEGVGRRRAQANVDSLGNLPCFEKNTESLARQNHPGCVVAVVHEVKEDNCLHEDIRQNRTHRCAYNILLLAPVSLKI